MAAYHQENIRNGQTNQSPTDDNNNRAVHHPSRISARLPLRTLYSRHPSFRPFQTSPAQLIVFRPTAVSFHLYSGSHLQTQTSDQFDSQLDLFELASDFHRLYWRIFWDSSAALHANSNNQLCSTVLISTFTKALEDQENQLKRRKIESITYDKKEKGKAQQTNLLNMPQPKGFPTKLVNLYLDHFELFALFNFVLTILNLYAFLC